MSLTAADVVVQAIHSNPRHGGLRFGPAHPEYGLGGTEDIPHLLYSYLERDQLEARQVQLSVYLGVGPVAGALWEQDMRVLERISGLEHPALPTIVGGGHIEVSPADGDPAQSGAAYIRVAMGVDVNDGRGIAEFLAEQPDGLDLGLQYFWQLTDALAALHDSGVVHRNLWPGTLVTYRADEETEEYRVQLARFEMSVLLANLLRSSRANPELREAVQRFYRDQDEKSRAYAPPERLDFIFGGSPLNIATEKGDVFALGVMAAEWLLGPDVLPDSFGSKAQVIEAQAQLRTRVARSSLPLPVQSLLERMMHPVESERFTAYEATEALARHFSDSTTLGGDEAIASHLVLFMPGKEATDKTLKGWDYIDESSDTEDGRDQVIQLIERDMALAPVFHSPNGAADFVRVGELEDRQRATSVIAGKELLWFVEHYWLRPGMCRRTVFDHAVVIKYVLERARHLHVLKQLQAYALPRRVFKVEAVSTRDADQGWLTAEQGRRPSWRPLTQPPSIRGRILQSRLRAHLEAMDWYLEYQGALLEARTYAFVLRRSPSATTAVLSWDREAEHVRNGRLSGLRLKVVSDPHRPGPAQHVSDQNGETAKGVWINLLKAGERRWSDRRYQVTEVRGAEELVIDIRGHRDLPERGWFRLEEDGASVPALIRQGEARLELERNPALLRQLVMPSGRSNDAWGGVAPNLPLNGEGRDAVLDVLQNQTMFALQGPPGTGKTEVTSEAVRQYLLRNRDARVLISAQSHDALDNLAERILGKLNMLEGAAADNSWLALRVAGTMAQDSLSQTMKGFVEEKATARLVVSSRRRSRDWLQQSRVEGVAPIVGAWRDVIRDAEIDLRLRIRRGANLVFATTGAATRENLVTYGSREPFDWVVVEEAARAWPTELALPLVRGTRWTLVGDQAQIGPFSRTDIERFLDSCIDDQDEEVQAMARSRDAFGRAFETFGSMFATATDQASGQSPTRTLSQQYRMAPAISEVVSTAFYSGSGGLQAMRTDCRPPVDHPEWLAGQSLVWIDTDPAERAENFWENPYEVDVVVALVERIRPQLERQSQTLAVLSPYRRQCEALTGRLDRSLVHTIDGFQGREADVVIASLVRDKILKDRPEVAMVGHLAYPPRSNVLLSRARELLVVVGRLPVFESHGGEHWAKVVETFRGPGGRVVAVKATGLR